MDADVVVIGAGAAGLAAALCLARRNLRVVVLEARERTGGRVWTQPIARAAVPAELGAEFIHGPATETMAWLRDAGAAAIDTGGESWTFSDGAGLRRDDDDFMPAAAIFEQAVDLPDDESVDQFLRRFDGDDAARKAARAARAFVEGFEAADPALASARAIGEEWRSGVDLTSARPLGGYRPVFERLSHACAAAGVAVRLSTTVRTIAWRRGFVSVSADNAYGELQTTHASAAIITLPVGVLRHRGDTSEVAFDPDLPALKREALASIEMGHVVKVTLCFRTAFWTLLEGGRYADAAFFRCEGQPFGAYWTQMPVRAEMIVAWAGGPRAIALADASKEDAIRLALDGFGSLFGEVARARDEFEVGVMHDWGADPYARGAYSYVATGGGDARAALATPVDDTLFFAGEATSGDGQGGTVNGALETGERAAREAAAAIGAARG